MNLQVGFLGLQALIGFSDFFVPIGRLGFMGICRVSRASGLAGIIGNYRAFREGILGIYQVCGDSRARRVS